MSTAFAITLAALLLCSLLSMLLFGVFGFRKENKRGYSFLSDFPFELNEGRHPLSRVSAWSVFFLAAFLALSSSTLLWNRDFAPYLPFAIVLAVLGALKAVSFVLLYRVPAYRFKFHILIDVFYFCFAALSCAFMGIFFLNMRAANSPLALGLMGVEVFLAVCLCLLALNPKLANWTQMSSTASEDGSVHLSRPKPFVLAFSEWIAIFLDCLSSSLFLLGVLFFEIA